MTQGDIIDDIIVPIIGLGTIYVPIHFIYMQNKLNKWRRERLAELEELEDNERKERNRENNRRFKDKVVSLPQINDKTDDFTVAAALESIREAQRFDNSVLWRNYVAQIAESKFTYQDIENEKNMEIRRIMIDRYGNENYIKDSGLKPIHEDEFGTLYSRRFFDGSVFMVVKVVNSTPEPDGSYKDYYLKVNHTLYGGITTAWQAVASTWRTKDGNLAFADHKDYFPRIET